MPINTYYPPTIDGRADWWQNIKDNNAALFAAGASVTQASAIADDSAWAVYTYRTIREAYDEVFKSIIAYCDCLLDGENGAVSPTVPPISPWPGQPTSGVLCGIEKRRESWVQLVKNLTGYNPSIGATLRLEAPVNPFDSVTYQAEIFNFNSPSTHTVGGKFRKANGKIDGINLYARKAGSPGWISLGRFNATPFTALVPVTSPTGPEDWEFQARAVKRDEEIGIPSMIVQQTIRG